MKDSENLQELKKSISRLAGGMFKVLTAGEGGGLKRIVSKYTSDEGFIQKLLSLKDKTKIMVEIDTKIGLTSHAEPEPDKTLRSSPKIDSKIKPKKSSAESTDHTIQRNNPSAFILANGDKILQLSDLESAIEAIDDKLFDTHVNTAKNDFSKWVKDVFGETELSHKIRYTYSRSALIHVLKEHFKPEQKITEQHVSKRDSIIKKIKSFYAKKIASIQRQNKSEKIQIAKIDDLVHQGLQQVSRSNINEAQVTYVQITNMYRQLRTDIRKEVYTNAHKLHIAISTVKRVKGDVSQDIKNTLDILKLPITEILIRLKVIDSTNPYLAIEEETARKLVERKKLKTGVPGFDEMVSPGIPSGTTILVSGGPGSGKTTFCIQMLGWAAERKEKCLFMTFEESEDRLIEHMESYGLDPKKYIKEGYLMIKQQDPFKISRVIEALLAEGRGELFIDINEILDIIPKGFTPDRVVIDSLSSISSAFEESSTAYRIYVNQLINILSKSGATSFLISEVQGVEDSGHGTTEEFLSDGVIVFYNLQRGNLKQNALEVLKMRGVNHFKKIVPFEFVSGQGMVVYPLEKVYM